MKIIAFKMIVLFMKYKDSKYTPILSTNSLSGTTIKAKSVKLIIQL